MFRMFSVEALKLKTTPEEHVQHLKIHVFLFGFDFTVDLTPRFVGGLQKLVFDYGGLVSTRPQKLVR